MNDDDMEISNWWGVSRHGSGKVAILAPPVEPMTPDQALVMAAWLVTLADPRGERFAELLEKVQST